MVVCGYCGIVNDQSDKFCMKCGSKFDDTGEGALPVDLSLSPVTGQAALTRGKNTATGGIATRETRHEKLGLRCSFCGKEKLVSDSKRTNREQFTGFVVLTCDHCGHVELFNMKKSIFDFE